MCDESVLWIFLTTNRIEDIRFSTTDCQLPIIISPFGSVSNF